MKDYISFKKSNCRNCYKCIRHCPVKSIRFSGSQANVMSEQCILCGQCYVQCPQEAKCIVDETERVSVLLMGDKPVIASLAPSFTAYFDGAGIEAMSAALQKLGFHHAEETALGATIVKREYEKLCAEGDRDVIITSCCHSVNLLVQKYYPAEASLLAPVVTPMQAHAQNIRERYSDCAVVFFGPCLAKKDEAELSGVDAVLTFEDLSAMLEGAHVSVERNRQAADTGLARFFPVTGGILNTMTSRSPLYTYMAVDGIDNCKKALEDILKGDIHKCFIEMSACVGSCSGGPVMEKHSHLPIKSYSLISSYAGKNDFSLSQPRSEAIRKSYLPQLLESPMPSEAELTGILHKMGKYKSDDELNCGSCGYNTCREKATAVFQGKAEISMCLPHLIDQSERFSNNILDNTPNGILVVNEACEVQQINPAAMHMLNIKSRADVIGEPVIRIMDPSVFLDVSELGKTVSMQRDYYAEYGRYLELSIVHDKTSGNLIALFRDVTDEEQARRSKEALSRQTVETADKVVDKQMRIVQEIASLLGETAAETKIALTKLKESISDEARQ